MTVIAKIVDNFIVPSVSNRSKKCANNKEMLEASTALPFMCNQI